MNKRKYAQGAAMVACSLALTSMSTTAFAQEDNSSKSLMTATNDTLTAGVANALLVPSDEASETPSLLFGDITVDKNNKQLVFASLVAGVGSEENREQLSLLSGALIEKETETPKSDEIQTPSNPEVVPETPEKEEAPVEVEVEENTLTAEDFGYKNLGICQVDDNLNVRKAPSTDSSILGKMDDFDACEILETDGDWYKISSGNVEGYVKREYIITGEEALSIAKEKIQTIATVTTENLRLRKENSAVSKVLGKLNKGAKLVLQEEGEEWAKVSCGDTTGYVSMEYITISEELSTAKTMDELKKEALQTSIGRGADLVNYALQFVGNRYVWGGESLTNGVDCSGFTMQVYRKYGIYLPHSSRAQPSYGRRVSAAEAQPGDLFFYGSGSYINHVGIYMGNGQIVHASGRKTGIKVSNAFYRNPVCVVRYL